MRKTIVAVLCLLASAAQAEWKLDQRVNPRDDTVTHSAALKGNKWQVFVDCRPKSAGLMTISILPPAPIRLDSGNVEMRFDKDTASDDSWMLVKNRALVKISNVVEINNWTKKKSLWVRLSSGDDNVLDLTGMSAAVSELKQRCDLTAF